MLGNWCHRLSIILTVLILSAGCGSKTNRSGAISIPDDLPAAIEQDEDLESSPEPPIGSLTITGSGTLTGRENTAVNSSYIFSGAGDISGDVLSFDISQHPHARSTDSGLNVLKCNVVSTPN